MRGHHEKGGIAMNRNFVITADNGEVLEEFPKEKNEFVQARWLAPQRMLCVSRNRSKSAGGTLELYKIE